MLNESQRTLAEVQAAAQGLDEAIESLSDIAQAKNPPYPKNDIEQRANMGRNTMRKQLERAVQSQREYEEKNAEKMRQAREFREAERQRLEEEQRKAEEDALNERRRIAEARQRIYEQDRELAEKRAEEQKSKEEEWTTEIDSQSGLRVQVKKRGRSGKRKKKAEEESDGEGNESGQERKRPRRKKSAKAGSPATDDEAGGPQKQRRLEGKGSSKKTRKFKSDELVVESESESEAATPSGKAETSGNEELHGSAMDVDKESIEGEATEDKPEANGAADDDENENENDNTASPPAAEVPELEGNNAEEVQGLEHDEDGDGDVAMDDAAPSAGELAGDEE